MASGVTVGSSVGVGVATSVGVASGVRVGVASGVGLVVSQVPVVMDIPAMVTSSLR